MEAQIFNHWPAREVPEAGIFLLNKLQIILAIAMKLIGNHFYIPAEKGRK